MTSWDPRYDIGYSDIISVINSDGTDIIITSGEVIIFIKSDDLDSFGRGTTIHRVNYEW